LILTKKYVIILFRKTKKDRKMKEQLQKKLYNLVKSGIEIEVENYLEKFIIKDKKIIVEDHYYVYEYRDIEDFKRIINIDTLEFLIDKLKIKKEVIEFESRLERIKK
jgi:hypothetical protein